MYQFVKEFFTDIVILRYFPCHRRRERSLVIIGNQFPVCYRCMFMLIGLTFVLPFAMLQFFPPWWQGVIICLGLNLPLVLDGGSQAFGMRTSTNLLRSVTGLLSGIGLSVFITSMSFTLVMWIIEIPL